MGKTLFVVESPSKAKKISKFLGKDYIIQASVGHVVDLAQDGKNNMGVNIEKGFVPKYQIIGDKKDKVKALISQAKKVDQILLATDPDREGESIAYHLSDLLKKENDNIWRVSFNSITKEAILKSLENPRDLDRNLFDAQQARRVLDRIVGFSVSPYLIKKLGPKLSAGRVQSVAVKMVVDREREIEAFDSEEYWSIVASLTKDQTPFVAKYTKKVTNEKRATKIKKDLEGDVFTIQKVEQSEQAKKPPEPLITATLAALAADKYKFAADRTMKAAQALYESGFITYLRTDSTRLDPSAVDLCRQWLQDNGYSVPKKGNTYGSSKGAQDAHEAIRPTKVESTPQNVYLSQDQQKIYALIWERFVASQMNPALYDTVKVDIKSSSGHLLKAAGKVLKFKGWLEIAEERRKEKKVTLPPLKKGEEVKLAPPGVQTDQKFTKPPSRFTIKTLIEELRKNGVGRPSTYDSIMSKITSRGYVEKKKNAFIPTKKGFRVIDELSKYFEFINYDYTAQMEDKLDLVAKGKLSYLDMMNDFYQPFKEQLRQAYRSSHKDYGFRCKNCGEEAIMYLRHGRFGYYLSCMNWPRCQFSLSCELVDGKPQPKNWKNVEDNIKCPECEASMVKIDGKFGPFYGCSKYSQTKCKGTRKAPFGKPCPTCGSDLYATFNQGLPILACMGYFDKGCKYKEDLPEEELPNPNSVAAKKIPPQIQKLIK